MPMIRIDKKKVIHQMEEQSIPSMGELAHHARIDPSHLSKLLGGRPFSSVTLDRLARALKCKPADILK